MQSEADWPVTAVAASESICLGANLKSAAPCEVVVGVVVIL